MAKAWAKELKHKTAHHAADWVEKLLSDGKPRIPRQIAAELNVDIYRVAEGLKILRRATPPRCAVIGEWQHLAAQLGVPLTGARKDATVYSCPGAEQLPREVVQTRRGPRVRGKRSASGSGVIAPKPYRTGFRWGNVMTTGAPW